MPETVNIDDASAQQLRHYARNILNLEVAQTENGPSLRAKILAAKPGTTEIPLSPEMVTAPPAAAVAAVASATEAKATRAIPSGRAGQHYAHDPKVRLKVMPTNDPTRPKDVQLAVGGDVVLIQRGKEVSIPYRHYLVLDAAIETVAVDSDEINPNTGLPFKIWTEQHSYPFQVLAMPSDEEIEAWEKRTSGIELA